MAGDGDGAGSMPGMPDMPGMSHPTGHDMGGMAGMRTPPAPHWPESLFAFAPQWLFLAGCVLVLALYVAGVARLRRRGDAWPLRRVALFTLGVGTVLLATCTGLGRYGMWLFSVHMVQHMVLSMLSPILLLLGAPVTLALRALAPAGAGRRGPREMLLAVLHSRVARVLSAPVVALPLFVASLYGLYFTPIFDALMRSETGHVVMLVHFLLVGLLFFWPVIGVDPAPHRPSHLMRLLELFVGMPFHAFFGVAVMMASTPLLSTFRNPPAGWGVSALGDQTAAGGIAWAFSEIPTLLVLLAVFAEWIRTEERASRRRDRAADRDGDAELAAYNAYLSSLAAGDASVRRG